MIMDHGRFFWITKDNWEKQDYYHGSGVHLITEKCLYIISNTETHFFQKNGEGESSQLQYAWKMRLEQKY